MRTEPFVKTSQSGWQERIDRQFSAPNAPVSKPFSLNTPDEDIDPEPLPATRPWPRIFPGL